MSEGAAQSGAPFRYVVTAVAEFDFMSEPSETEQTDIVDVISSAIRDAVDGFSRRNLAGTSVDFVSVNRVS